MAIGSHGSDMAEKGTALADGLYWYAEKLNWGYEDVEKNPTEALRLYKQAAGLGSSDALIRLGELYEMGRGTERDPALALASYQQAIEAGSFLGHGFIAKFLSTTAHPEKADGFWAKFFAALRRDPTPTFTAESPAALIYAYLDGELRAGREPNHLDQVRRYRRELVSHHMGLLENTFALERLTELEVVGGWLATNLPKEGLG